MRQRSEQLGFGCTCHTFVTPILLNIVQIVQESVKAKEVNVFVIDHTRQAIHLAASTRKAKAHGGFIRPDDHILAVIDNPTPVFLHKLQHCKSTSTSIPNTHRRTVTVLPLQRNLRVFGALEILHHTSHLTERDKSLLTLLADQATLALESAEQYEKSIKQNAEFRKFTEIIQVLTSTVDLDKVLQLIIDSAIEVIPPAETGTLHILADDKATLVVAASFGFEAQDLYSARFKIGEGYAGWVFENRRPLVLDNTRIDSRTKRIYLPPHRQAKSSISVPLIVRDQPVGVLTLDNLSRYGAFSQSHLPLVSNFANQAAIAIEKARLYNDLQQSVDQLLALHQAAQSITASLNLDDVLKAAVQTVEHVFEVNDCAISLHVDGKPNLVMSADSPWLARLRRLPEVESARQQAISRGVWQTAFIECSKAKTIPANIQRQVYALCAPLNTRTGSLGVIEAYGYDPALISQRSGSLFAALAIQIGAALENARLYGQLEEKEKRLRLFLEKLVHVQEDERRLIANDIHDGLTQMMLSADMHLDALISLMPPGLLAEENEELTKARARLKSAIKEARQLITGLRPSTLDDFGLSETLCMHFQDLQNETGWDIEYEINLANANLGPTVETMIFRIVQEALTNVRKHADTNRVAVTLDVCDAVVYIEIQDWGLGVDPSALDGERDAFGLVSMRERAQLIGGKCVIESQRGEGTRVKVQIPLRHLEYSEGGMHTRYEKNQHGNSSLDC